MDWIWNLYEGGPLIANMEQRDVNNTLERYGATWVGLWQHIRMGWDRFASFIWFEVGVGSQNLF